MQMARMLPKISYSGGFAPHKCDCLISAPEKGGRMYGERQEQGQSGRLIRIISVRQRIALRKRKLERFWHEWFGQHRTRRQLWWKWLGQKRIERQGIERQLQRFGKHGQYRSHWIVRAAVVRIRRRRAHRRKLARKLGLIRFIALVWIRNVRVRRQQYWKPLRKLGIVGLWVIGRLRIVRKIRIVGRFRGFRRFGTLRWVRRRTLIDPKKRRTVRCAFLLLVDYSHQLRIARATISARCSEPGFPDCRGFPLEPRVRLPAA
jgi:hypothetical protein